VLDTTIVTIETWACSIPLDHPITFRWNTIRSREYTVIRVHTAGGLVGESLGLSRKMPIDVCIEEAVAPLLVGKDALDVATRLEDVRAGTACADQYGILAPARSLIDVCLWDLRAKALDVPLWRLLGGHPRPVPVLLVEGYELPGESDVEFAERLAERAKSGYRSLKIEAAGYEDQHVLERRFGLFRDLVGDDTSVVIDVNGAWRSVREAADAIGCWSRFAPEWVEDPFPKDRLGEVAVLRDHVAARIGTGDEVTRPNDLVSLVEANAVDVIRVDATTVGGISAATDVVSAARGRDIPVSTHAHPVIHQHLSFAWPNTTYVELFPDDRPFEPSYKMLRHSLYPKITDGHLQPPQEPGVGIELDLDVVGDTAYRHATIAG
jgi:L-alanine-DL-glutamate epimerase-like enolase superfamily enzyme